MVLTLLLFCFLYISFVVATGNILDDLRDAISALKHPSTINEVEALMNDPSFIVEMERIKSEPQFAEAVRSSSELYNNYLKAVKIFSQLKSQSAAANTLKEPCTDKCSNSAATTDVMKILNQPYFTM